MRLPRAGTRPAGVPLHTIRPPLWSAAAPTTHRLIERITPRQWHLSTPCAGMDVAALVQHLVVGLDQFAAVPSVGRSEAAAADGSQVSTVGHREAPTVYLASCERLLEVWAAPETLGSAYAMPWGETPGAMLVGFMVIEQVAHGWDLAHATGQHPTFGDEVAAATLDLARSYDDETIRMPGMFGPVVAVPPDALAIDRLAGFLGRHP